MNMTRVATTKEGSAIASKSVECRTERPNSELGWSKAGGAEFKFARCVLGAAAEAKYGSEKHDRQLPNLVPIYASIVSRIDRSRAILRA